MPKNAKQSTASSKELATLAASVLGARGGAAGVGEAKRRGSSEHYRELAPGGSSRIKEISERLRRSAR